MILVLDEINISPYKMYITLYLTIQKYYFLFFKQDNFLKYVPTEVVAVFDDDTRLCRVTTIGTVMAVTTMPAMTKLPRMMDKIFVLLKLCLKMKGYLIAIPVKIGLIHTCEQSLMELMVS
jgi:hypothetical protein